MKSHAQWRTTNPEYYRGAVHVARVQEWRRKNPGYAKGKKRRKQGSPLQDFATTQVPEDVVVTKNAGPQPSGILQRGESDSERDLGNEAALQVSASLQLPLIVGLMVTMMGDALQDNIVPFTRGLVERGRRVLAANSDELGFMGAPQTVHSHAHYKTPS